MGKDLKLKDVAERITDALLREAFWKKENMINIILPVLKIWMNQRNRVRKFKKPTDQSKLHFTIEKKEVDLRFWLEVARKHADEDLMQQYYKEQRVNQKNKNVSNYEDWFSSLE